MTSTTCQPYQQDNQLKIARSLNGYNTEHLVLINKIKIATINADRSTFVYHPPAPHTVGQTTSSFYVQLFPIKTVVISMCDAFCSVQLTITLS